MTFTQATSFMRVTTSNSSNFSILSDRALTFRNPGMLHRKLFVIVTKVSAFTPDVVTKGDYKPNVEHSTFNTWYRRVTPASFLVPLHVTIETRTLRGVQMEVSKILNGYENIDRYSFFSLKKDSRIRDHEVKGYQEVLTEDNK